MNLAHKHDSPQADVVQFPKKERIAMTNKLEGYTRTPNYLVDDDYLAEMSGNALKCYVVISRFTEGFSRQNWAIDSKFLLKKTGIKKPHTLFESLKYLEEKGLISVERSDGKPSRFSISNPCQKTALVSTPHAEKGHNTNAEKGHNTNAEKGHNTNAEKGHTKKESNKKENSKENIKERERGNSPDEILEIWNPNFDDLNAWLVRSGLMPMTENLIEQVLLEFNPYYETKYKLGQLTENQMYSNFVKWMKRGVNFTSSKPNPRNVNDVWGEPTQYAPCKDNSVYDEGEI